uniref:Uncharacterized protein n=1 Tax=viral metagenome TaxID=1070528 RepID=A0A6M3KUZ4_9ZZZZ
MPDDEKAPVEETQGTEEEHQVSEGEHDAPRIDDASIGAMFDDEAQPETKEEPETTQEDDGESTETEPEPDQPTALEAPRHWTAADKETFTSLPRESQDFLLRRHREMEGDYTRGKQSIAEEARALEGLKPLGEALRRDPDLREYLKNYKQQQTAGPETDDDPIEQIKKDAAELAYQRIKKEREQEQRDEYSKTLESTLKEHQSDPDYETVMNELWSFVKTQDEELQPIIFQRLDRDPKYFSKKFKEVKTRLEKGNGESPAPRKETVITPKLRAPGAGTAETAEMSRKQKLTAIKKRMDGGSVTAIGEFFDMQDK